MPIFSYSQTPSGETFDEFGNRIVHPAGLLQIDGPKMPVRIGRAPGANENLKEEIPEIEGIGGIALFDTGATRSSIDLQTAAALNLPVVDHDVPIITPSFSGQTRVFNSAHISAIDSNKRPLEITLHRLLGADLERQGIHILIGRDILAKAIFIYNGYSGSFSFSV